MQIIILAGGKGTRIKSVLGNTPKILARVKDRSFLDWLILWINSWDIKITKPIILSTCIGHELIKEYSEKKKYPIKCEQEKKPLGTFGAVANAASENISENYLVLNGDTIFQANFKKIHDEFVSSERLEPLIFLKESFSNERYGGYMKTNQGWVFSNNKTNLISLGAFFISRDILIKRWVEATNLKFEKNEINRLHDQEWMIDKHCFGDKASLAITLKENIPFLDIGIPSSLIKAQKYIPEILKLKN